MRIAFVEVAPARYFRAHAPRLLIFGQTFLCSETLRSDELHATHHADRAFIEEALELLIAWHATTVVRYVATCSTLIEGLLDRLGIFPRKSDRFFEVAMLVRSGDRDRLLFVTVRRGGNIDDVDRRIGQKLFHGFVHFAMALRIDPCLRLFCGSIPDTC